MYKVQQRAFRRAQTLSNQVQTKQNGERRFRAGEYLLAGLLIGVLAVSAACGNASASDGNRPAPRLTGQELLDISNREYFDIVGGRPVQYMAGRLVCQLSKGTLYVDNPLVVQENGFTIVSDEVPDPNDHNNFHLDTFDINHPGDPNSPGLPACKMESYAGSQYPTGTIHSIVAGNGAETGDLGTGRDIQSGNVIRLARPVDSLEQLQVA